MTTAWTLHRDRCTSCEECVKACPFQILEMMDGFPQLKADALCMGCYTCADLCPEQAIELTMDKEQ